MGLDGSNEVVLLQGKHISFNPLVSDTAAHGERDIGILVDERNSGSVFAQWRRAATEAKGEFG